MRASLPAIAAKGHQSLRMDALEPQLLEVGAEPRRRRIVYRWREAEGAGAPLALGLSLRHGEHQGDRRSGVGSGAKARHDALRLFRPWAFRRRPAHATIGDWLEDSIEVWAPMGEGPRIVIGSSMGGWIALLLARHLAQGERSHRACRPRADRAGLRHDRGVDVARAAASREGRNRADRRHLRALGLCRPLPHHQTSDRGGSLASARRRPLDPGCPVRILQGMRDADVPWRHSLALVDLLAGANVELTLIRDGDHRLSAPQNLQRLTATIATLSDLPDR